MKWIKLTDDAVIPQRGTTFAAGYDLVAREDVTIPAQQSKLVSTGIAWEMVDESDNNTVGLVWPRSGMAVRDNIDVGAGVIDADYTGEIKVLLRNTSARVLQHFKAGERIAQLVIQNFDVVEGDTFNLTSRTGGFGSTGR